MTYVKNRIPLPCGSRPDLGPGWTTVYTRDGVKSDDDVLEEIYIQDCYGLRGLPTQTWRATDEEPGATVIDVGANIGAFTLAALQFGAEFVVAVEPEPANREVLAYNVERHKRGNAVIPVKAAVGAEAGTTTVIGTAGQAHTDSRETFPLDNGVHTLTLEVEQVALASVINEVYGRIGLLKVDIEGGEYDAFSTVTPELLWRCERVVIEWHGPNECPWVPDPPPVGDLVARLLRTHNVQVHGEPPDGGMIHAVRYDQPRRIVV